MSWPNYDSTFTQVFTNLPTVTARLSRRPDASTVCS